MTNLMLYLTFLVLGIVLFIGIYLYSKAQLKNNDIDKCDDYQEGVSDSKPQSFFKRIFSSKAQEVVAEKNEPLLDGDTFSAGGVVAKVARANQVSSGDVHSESFGGDVQEVETEAPAYEAAEITSLDDGFENGVLLESESHKEGYLYKDNLEGDSLAEPLVENIVKSEVNNAQKPKSRADKFKSGADSLEIVAKISGEEFVARDKCLSVYRKYDYLFTRKLGIFGKNSLTQVWESVELADKEAEFDDIAVSLQLADKTGAMTRKESNTFSTLAIEMADNLDKAIVFSMDIDDSVERGRVLDTLARKYDAKVVSNIIPKRRKGFRSTDLQSCTRDLQMVQSSNGVFNRFAKLDGVNTLRYSLAIAGSDGKYVPLSGGDSFEIQDIVVFLNVPLVEKPVEAFDLMIADARRLAAWLDGKVVDKNSRNMTARTLDMLSGQISSLEKEMVLDGLTPGDATCKKLF